MPLSAQATACTSFSGLSSGPACYGTGFNTFVSFKAYADQNPDFTSSVELEGDGDSETINVYFPDAGPSRTVVGYAASAARVNLGGGFRGESANASAAAALGTGGLKVSGSTSELPANPQESVLNAQMSTAVLRDQISVYFPKSLGSVDITLTMVVTGTLVASPAYGAPGVQAQFQALNGFGQELGYAGRQWSEPGAVSDTISDTFTLVGEVDLGDRWQATFDLQSMLFTYNVVPGSRVDFGNSAYLDIQLPDSAGYTSASGEFLATPVPEPSTLALLSLGLAVGLRVAAQRRTPQPAGISPANPGPADSRCRP